MLFTLFQRLAQRQTQSRFFTHRYKMPFKSEAQKGWMYANHPQMAKQWQEHTPTGKKLPAKLKKSNKSKGK
jgi:hypothetical protein